jgi:hypothetical protein
MKFQSAGEKPLKPQGGYCSVSSLTIGILWWSLSEGLISSWAVRVGLALFEQRLRRAAFIWTEKKAGRGVPEFTPRFLASELATLCGLPEKRVRSALAELIELGLLQEFSEAAIRFAPSVSEMSLSEEQRSAFASWFALLTKRKRVPIPRRALVLACESSSRALIAVILGVCLRCSWLRPGEGFSFSGRVSCQWLARRFRLSPRAVQGAKEHLVGLEWIQRTGDITRFGERLLINPEWERIAATNEAARCRAERAGGESSKSTDGTNSAGVEPAIGTNSAGVFLIRESLPSEESKDQRESRGEARPESGPGLFSSGSGEEKTQASSELPPPRLSGIRREDFEDVGRALELLRQAAKCSLMPDDREHSQLLWMTAVEKARTTGAKNPAGLFLFLVKNRKWNYLSQGHEEAAQKRLKAHFQAERTMPPLLVPGSCVSDEILPTIPAPPRLSKDALLLKTLRCRGVRNLDAAYPSLRAAGWDRPRFVAALAELENPRPLAASGV